MEQPGEQGSSEAHRFFDFRSRRKAGDCVGLISYLDDPAPHIRRGAAKALGKLQYQPAEAALIDAMSDGEMGDEAVKSLGKLRSTRAVDPMLALLGHGMPRVADFQIISALGKIGDDRASARLVEALDTRESWYEATEALGKLGTEEGHEAIVAHPPSLSRWWTRLTWTEARAGKDRRVARDEDRLVRPAVRVIPATIMSLILNFVSLGLAVVTAVLANSSLVWSCGGVLAITAFVFAVWPRKYKFPGLLKAAKPLPEGAAVLGNWDSARSKILFSWVWFTLPEVLVLAVTYLSGVALIGIWIVGAIFTIAACAMCSRLARATAWQHHKTSVLLSDRDDTYDEWQLFTATR